MTENHGYQTPTAGATDWHVPLNENFRALDTDAPVVDVESALDTYTPKGGALFVASDTGRRYAGDGSQWTEVPAPSGAGSGISDGSTTESTLGDFDFTGAPSYPSQFDPLGGMDPTSVSLNDVLIGGTGASELQRVSDNLDALF